RAYVRRDRFAAGVYDVKLEKMSQRLDPESAPPFDVRLMLLDLARPGSGEQAREGLLALARDNPGRPEPYVQLAYLAWKANAIDDVQALFEKAYALGDRSTRMLWDYGRMIAAT